ncbi:hypothetical protein OC842_007695 [Tilletia horrida]|uniref:Uncharacterized protein n=1 Tax=Tilletia horrida TaxID=155126 RepID=A0AAN6JM60_9BASI|nr:hypothetical protein OC842_007695 [Tilletia horrida]
MASTPHLSAPRQRISSLFPLGKARSNKVWTNPSLAETHSSTQLKARGSASFEDLYNIVRVHIDGSRQGLTSQTDLMHLMKTHSRSGDITFYRFPTAKEFSKQRQKYNFQLECALCGPDSQLFHSQCKLRFHICRHPIHDISQLQVEPSSSDCGIENAQELVEAQLLIPLKHPSAAARLHAERTLKPLQRQTRLHRLGAFSSVISSTS